MMQRYTFTAEIERDIESGYLAIVCSLADL